MGRFGGQESVFGPGVSLLGLAALLGSIGMTKDHVGVGQFVSRIFGFLVGFWFILGGLNMLPMAWTCSDGECEPHYLLSPADRE